jgi:glycosyltransferase involved in cell wall biosynthesis
LTALTVIIPTHNPRPDLLGEVLDCLKAQSLSLDQWELIIIDNASHVPVDPSLLQWHPGSRLVVESRLGLTFARLRGILEAKSDLLVWVDDDNLLDPGYLENALNAFQRHPQLGAAGGPSVPRYQQPPPPWFSEGLVPLGCRYHGEHSILMRWDPAIPSYPHAAPIGAGLVIRKQPMQHWAQSIAEDPVRQNLGRRGSSLRSGEDNDINLCLLRGGWQLAYLPDLRLTHVIHSSRLRFKYQMRLAYASFRDFVLVLDFYGIRLWPAIPRWTVLLRAFMGLFRYQVWRGAAHQIRWSGALGQYVGRSLLKL